MSVMLKRLKKYFLVYTEGTFISAMAKSGVAFLITIKILNDATIVLPKLYGMFWLRFPPFMTTKPVDVMSIPALDSPSTYLLETSVT